MKKYILILSLLAFTYGLNAQHIVTPEEAIEILMKLDKEHFRTGGFMMSDLQGIDYKLKKNSIDVNLNKALQTMQPGTISDIIYAVDSSKVFRVFLHEKKRFYYSVSLVQINLKK
jgi:hypothetical protein